MAGVVALGANTVDANYADFGDDLPGLPGFKGDHIDIGDRPIDWLRPKIKKYKNDDVEDMDNGEQMSGTYSQFQDINGVSSYLGYGYNIITSPYMVKDYVRMENPIIDMVKIKTCPLTIVRENSMVSDTISGQSMESYMDEFNASINVYGNYGKVFSGGAKAEFQGSQSVQKLYTFYKTYVNKRSFDIHLGGGAASLKTKLSTTFQNALYNMTPAQLFHDYGTHLIAEVAMGGRLEMNTTYWSETADYTTEVTTAINVHAKYLGSSINAEMSLALSSALSTLNVQEHTGTVNLGGASLDLTTPEAIAQNRNAWLMSFDQDLGLSAMIGLVGDQSLIPLWDLVDDDHPERKAELENYFILAAGEAYDDLCDNFKLNTNRYVNVTVDGEGEVEGNNGEYQRGEMAELTAVPNTGYVFEGWYAGEEKVSSNPFYSFAVTFDTNLTAKFVVDNTPPDGSPEHPYKITSKQDFMMIQQDMTACYELESDIDFGSSIWTPFENTFTGSIDGKGHTLSNLRIEKIGGLGNGCYFVGLFSTLGNGARISNLTIRNSTFTYQQSNNESPLIYGGFICGNLGFGAVVENCTFNSTYAQAKVNFSLVGTVAGYARGIIRNCELQYAKVFGYDVVGGFAGTLDYDAEAEYCKITKSLSGYRSEIALEAKSNSGASYRAGGIAGYCFSSTVRNCTVEHTNFRLTGVGTYKPAMGYIVGHLNYANIYDSIVNTSSTSRTNSTSNSTYYFANYNGKVGKKEGSCVVS